MRINKSKDQWEQKRKENEYKIIIIHLKDEMFFFEEEEVEKIVFSFFQSNCWFCVFHFWFNWEREEKNMDVSKMSVLQFDFCTEHNLWFLNLFSCLYVCLFFLLINIIFVFAESGMPYFEGIFKHVPTELGPSRSVRWQNKRMHGSTQRHFDFDQRSSNQRFDSKLWSNQLRWLFGR